MHRQTHRRRSSGAAPPTPSRGKGLLPSGVLSALVGLCLVGCGDGPDEGRVRDAEGWALLGRGADRILDQPGELLPDPENADDGPWGRLGRMGWSKAVHRAHGRRAVRATGSNAFLTLPAAVVRERALELDAWLEPAGADAPLRARVQVSLNGVGLGAAELGPRPATVALTAPASAWVVGDNVLQLALEAGQGDPRLALARVRYDTPRAVAHARASSRARLEPDTGLEFWIEPLAAPVLRIEGRAEGPGTLQLEVRALDHATGDTLDVLQGLRVPLQEQSFARALSFPDQARRLLGVRVAWEGAGASPAAFELETLGLSEAEPVARPLVFLIALDTLAARNTSLHGYARDTTPALAALGADGVVFERCLSNATWTLPSFLSLMTGQFPGSHRGDPSVLGRDRHVELWEQWYLTDDRWTLAEALRARGYRTAGWVDSVWLRERFNFPQGFEAFDEGASFIEKPDPDGGLRYGSKGALAWLDALDPDEPAFVFLHAFDAHGPYSPDAARRGRYRADLDETARAPADGIHNAFQAVPAYITEAEWDADALPAEVPLARVRASYDEGVRMTDAFLGEFLQALRERGLYERALIVVTSDHGETMGDTDYRFGHGVVEEAVLHVPLVVKLPGRAGAGTRVAETVSLVDVYPSVLAVAGGFEDADTAQARQGRIVFDAAGARTAAPRPAFSETGLCRQYSLELDGWRLVETWPGQESAPEFLLTHPLAAQLLRGDLDDALLAQGVPAATLAALRADAPLCDWIAAGTARGFTPATWAGIRATPQLESRLGPLRRALRGPFHALYAAGSPTDVAAEHPQRVEALRARLAEALTRRDAARALGQAPTAPVTLSAEQLEELGNIGYVQR